MFLQLQELVIIFMLIPSVALVILVTQGGVYQSPWCSAIELCLCSHMEPEVN